METREIEVRFLDINKSNLLQKLKALGAVDHGEVMLDEVIIYDKELKWQNEKRFVRLRKSGDITKLTYKQHMPDAKDGAREVEFLIEDIEKGVLFLEKIGLQPLRRQQKKRHTLHLNSITVDIDTWPRIPTYAEFEGPTLDSLKIFTETLGLDWSKVVYEDAKHVIEKIYNIPVGSLRWFTFERFE